MKKKRFLSFMLMLSMLFGVIPVKALREDVSAAVYRSAETQEPEEAIVENIINNYKVSGVADDGNIEWFLADFAAYEVLNPEAPVLTAEQNQAALDKLIEKISGKTDKPSDLAKTIIALRAMGYDARKVYTKDGDKLDLVEKLTDISRGTAAANTYTLPYVLIALQQGEGYITEETEQYLIETALAGKETWAQWGLDGATPMVLALAPYYNEDEAVKTAIDETVEDIGAGQSESGAILSYGSDNAPSTGLAIAAVAAVGKSAKDVKNNNKSLIDGLMSLATEELNGFKPTNNTFATEQGLRGLLAQQLLENEKNVRVYDFKEKPLNEARATTGNGDNNPGLEGGEGGEGGSDKITVYFTLYGDEVHGAAKKEKDEHTLKKGNLDEWISKTKVLMDKESTAMDLVEKMLKENDIEYINDNGYLSEIKGLGEFDNGALSGWMYTLNGEHPKTIGLAEYVLEDGDIIVLHYTDDYKQETEKKGSGATGGSVSSGSSSGNKTDSSVNIPIIAPNTGNDSNAEEFKFVDVKLSDWFYEAVKYVTLKKLMNGTDKGFEPELNMSRAMLVTVLYRLAGTPEVMGTNKFTDVADGEWYTNAVIWATENGIVNGISETEFAPNENITREQLATIIYRYANFKGQQTENTASLTEFADCEEISTWAKTAFSWARAVELINGTTENTLSPKAEATRAQVAVILMRFLELK